jgi:high-affinity nickel permease
MVIAEALVVELVTMEMLVGLAQDKALLVKETLVVLEALVLHIMQVEVGQDRQDYLQDLAAMVETAFSGLTAITMQAAEAVVMVTLLQLEMGAKGAVVVV